MDITAERMRMPGKLKTHLLALLSGLSAPRRERVPAREDRRGSLS